MARGIISIFAYNWDELGRGARIALSITPLLIAQGLFSYAFLKRRDSIAWTESTAGFLMLMLAAAIALISQTYQIPGDLAGFLQLWMILSVPLLFLTNSTLCTFIYLVGITSWTFITKDYKGQHAGFWLFFVPVIVHFWMNIRHTDRKLRSNILGWAISITLLIVLIRIPEWRDHESGILSYGILFGLLYVLGRKLYGEEEYPWKRPFQSIAIAGVLVMGTIMAF